MVKETLTEFKDSLKNLNEKDDKIIGLIHDISKDLTRINHDLYGNGRQGLFEEFKNFKENDFRDLKKKTNKNAKIIYGGMAILTFLSFLPVLKGFILLLIN
jgi:hypothetical protein